VPAVAVTAFSGAHPRAAALAAGFRAHLAKPVDPEMLCRTVAEVVSTARALSP
jgi:CheY-like chemotaxis protein